MSGVLALTGLTACGGSSGGSAASFCALKNSVSSIDPTKDLAGAQTALDKAADAAPSAIKSDVSKLRDAFKSFTDQVKAAGVDLSNPSSLASASPATLAKLQAAEKQLTSSDITKASQNVTTWISKNCK